MKPAVDGSVLSQWWKSKEVGRVFRGQARDQKDAGKSAERVKTMREKKSKVTAYLPELEEGSASPGLMTELNLVSSSMEGLFSFSSRSMYPSWVSMERACSAASFSALLASSGVLKVGIGVLFKQQTSY